MKNTHTFTIYDAAAGSGKTFTLVKEYLSVILGAKDNDYYKYLLAITFTNKAVAEMKQRVLNTLTELAEWNEEKNPSEIAKVLSEETNFTFSEMAIKAGNVLKHLLNHYSNFTIETIDGFNHKLIRTFAKELKLAANFEVFLDILLLISEAVDRLIDKTGENENNTRFILDYALEKLDDDKSWDITKDIAKAAKLIYDETNADKIKTLLEKDTKTFIKFKNQLLSKKRKLSQEAKTIAEETLALISQSGVEFSDFSGQYLPKFLKKISLRDFAVKFELKWQEKLITGEAMYNKGLPKKDPHTASVMEAIQPKITKQFLSIKQLLFKIQLTEALLKNITPLSVINLVQQEIEQLKTERNILPISDFNKLINKQIKNQPAPFIYERLGERFRHFFIDEFQDTSALQWENLMPLIENALSQQYHDGNKGSLLLVGDVKQSIYRWRGGLPEQFLNLINHHQPFVEKQQVKSLDTNYRSREEIIKFNNRFFSYLSGYLGDPKHKKLFEDGNKQKHTKKQGGYINFTFVLDDEEEDKKETQAKEVLAIIKKLKENDYNYKDICVLTRKNEEAAYLGKYLMEEDIPVVSPDSLLLQYASKIKCLITVLTLTLYPENEQAKIELLYFLHKHFDLQIDQHTFFSELLNTSPKSFSEKLKRYSINLDFQILQKSGLYEGCEYCIQQLGFNKESDAYLFEFMDFVWQFEQQPLTGKQLFLEQWELNKNKLSVSANENIDGVQLMTVHKAKGLEFEVVIFPYAEKDIYKEIEPKAWYVLTEEENEYPFNEFLINYNQQLQLYGGEQGACITEERTHQLELDNFNILYVAFTRAIDQLYVLSEKPKDTQKDKPISKFNQFFKAYFSSINIWNDDQLIYEQGAFSPPEIQENNSNKRLQITPNYNSVFSEAQQLKIAAGNALLWKNNLHLSVEEGKMFHSLMAKIKYHQDFDAFKQTQPINREIKNKIELLLSHPKLTSLFDASVSQTIYTEKEICNAKGEIIIPDRINISTNNEVTIVDYKTGSKNSSHQLQINQYAEALSNMGYKIIHKYLVYISETYPDLVNVN